MSRRELKTSSLSKHVVIGDSSVLSSADEGIAATRWIWTSYQAAEHAPRLQGHLHNGSLKPGIGEGYKI